MRKKILGQIFAVATLFAAISGCDTAQTTPSQINKSPLFFYTWAEQQLDNPINAALTKREALDYIFSKIHPQMEGIANVTFHDGDFLGYEYAFRQTDGSLSETWRISLYNDEQMNTDSIYYFFWDRELNDPYSYGNDYAVNIFTRETIDFKNIADYNVFNSDSDKIRNLLRSLYRNLTYKNMIQEGDWGFFDKYREEYNRLLKGEISFIYEPRGTSHYIDDLLSLLYDRSEDTDFDVNDYFYDWWPDFYTEIPELIIYSNPETVRWIFEYQPQSDRFVMREVETGISFWLSNFNHSYDKPGNSLFDIDYVNDETYKVIKEEYAKMDFSYEYKKGNPKVYDFYLDNFRRLMNCEAPFKNPDTGEVEYLSELYWDENFDLNEFSYEFFDMDGDDTPELYMLNDSEGYLFKYIPDKDSFILWYNKGSTYSNLYGSGKAEYYHLSGHGQFYILDEVGQIKKMVNFIDCYEHRTVYAVDLPHFRNENGEWKSTVIITDKMKEQAYYDENYGYLFKITKAQYNELLRDYFTAESPEERVFFSYTELFGVN